METLSQTYYFDIIKDNAKTSILKDRERFSSIYKIIEDYCSDPRISKYVIISNLDKILNNEESGIDRLYEIYCENPFYHAKQLAMKFLAVGKWCKLTTKITNQEFEIEYDARKMVSIYTLELANKQNANISLTDLLSPITIGNINYMPPELEIIDIYKRLYLPNHAEEWTTLIQHETTLLSLIKTRNIEYGSNYEGEIIRRKKSNIEDIKMSILNILPNVVVLGHWAVNCINVFETKNTPESHVDKLQVISQETEKVVNYVIDFLKKENIQATYREQYVHLPKDFRIRRYTLYILKKNKEFPFMDIFNSAEFELIPFIDFKPQQDTLSTSQSSQSIQPFENNIKIANPYVLLRFAVIDLWNLKFIEKLGKIDKSAFEMKIASLFELIYKIKKSNWMKQAFGTKYIGINVNYLIAKKQETLKHMHFPYYPAMAIQAAKNRITY